MPYYSETWVDGWEQLGQRDGHDFGVENDIEQMTAMKAMKAKWMTAMKAMKAKKTKKARKA